MRSLARWGCLPLLAAPLGSWALGLGGDIETHSYLNQPLNAEIPFTATAEEMQSLRVALAPVSMFTSQGIEYPAVLNTLQLRIGRNAAGQNVIQITSTQPIGEPFLTILVQATHNRGSTTREYSMLLDPPLFLSNQGAPEPISAPATRPAPETVAGGAIQRPPAEPVRQPAQAPAPAVSSSAPPAPVPAPAGSQAVGSDGASYTVQGGDTLWSIAERYRPSGASTNQTMISIFETNPGAFEGNINRLRRGSILRIPPATTIGATSASAATTEVRRQIEEWRASGTTEPRLVLIAPSEEAGAAAPGGAGDSARVSALENQVENLEAELAAARAEAAEAQRLLEVQSRDLANLQNNAAEAQAAADTSIETLVDEDAIFAEDVEAAPEAADAAGDADAAVPEEPVAAADEQPAPVPTVTPTPPAAPEPSIVDQVLAQVMKPVVYIPALIVVLVIAALAFLRRRRGDLEDVTGQWEALEAEIDEEVDHAATARIRARSREPDMVVVEGDRGDDTAEERQLGGTAEIEALTMDVDEPPRPRAKAPPREEDSLADQTMSSQTVINLDQADPIAEADFHMAYGLYDQAADLISKALSADPTDRKLKLKLLEVFFVWGNKESFLESAQNLRSEIGGGPDWDKVVIMGKQICPDEPLFSEATASAGEVDLDLESSAEAPGLDFAFDESGENSMIDFGVDDGDLSLAASGAHRVAGDTPAAESDDDMLDIGAQTQAGLEAALLDDLDDAGGRTMPGGELDDLDSTMESPTVETEAALSDEDFGALTIESPTVEALGPDAPTVETPTIESPAAGLGGDTVEQPRPEAQSSTVEMTAEIELDDLGLDVSELEDLSDEILELPNDSSADDDEMLSATGVTQVLHDDDGEIDFTGTAVIEDEEATMLAPGFDVEATGIRTEVLEQRPSDFDPEPPESEDDLDLNLDDFSSALDGGADTIEQPMASRFSGLDLDIGADVPADDEPTGTEEFSPLDPQTMTEVGTKLDLARAYIDMGDPEGAKSILEEVLSEGDAGQRSEAQALIDALPA